MRREIASGPAGKGGYSGFQAACVTAGKFYLRVDQKGEERDRVFCVAGAPIPTFRTWLGDRWDSVTWKTSGVVLFGFLGDRFFETDHCLSNGIAAPPEWSDPTWQLLPVEIPTHTISKPQPRWVKGKDWQDDHVYSTLVLPKPPQAKSPKHACCGLCGDVLYMAWNFQIGKRELSCTYHGAGVPVIKPITEHLPNRPMLGSMLVPDPRFRSPAAVDAKAAFSAECVAAAATLHGFKK